VASFSLYLPRFYHFSFRIKRQNSKPKSDSRPRIDVPKEVFELLSPYNWDFRTIPKSLLKSAVEAEYLRSCQEFRTAAVACLHKEISGRSIRDYLIEANMKKLNYLPPKVYDELPEEWLSEFSYLLWHDCYYPMPFTWLLEKGIIQEHRRATTEPAGTESRLVNIHPMNKKRMKHIRLFLSIPWGFYIPNYEEFYGYHFLINFDGNRNEDLVKAFSVWVKEEAKKRRELPVHGRASAPRWHRLKQLAAKRLSDAGLNWKESMRKITEHEKISPLADHNNVLPKYNSPGAWHDAVKEANFLVKKVSQMVRYQHW